MAWTCPKCNRKFKNPNQWHSCVQISIADHFLNKDPQVNAIYDHLMAFVDTLGRVRISSMKSGILVATKSTFLALKPKRKWLDVEFYLDHDHPEFQVYKTFQVSKNRYVHYVRLEQVEDINDQLMQWIESAYNLIGN